MTANQMSVLLDVYRGSFRRDRHPATVDCDVDYLQRAGLVRQGRSTEKGDRIVEVALHHDGSSDSKLAVEIRQRNEAMLKYLGSDSVARVSLGELRSLLCELSRVKFAMKVAVQSMDRARSILTESTNYNWSMLDTSELRKLLEAEA